MANKLRLNRASNDSGRRRRRRRRANGPTFLVTLQDDTSTAQQSRHLQKTLAKKKSDLKRGTLTGTCGATQTTQGRNQTDAKKKRERIGRRGAMDSTDQEHTSGKRLGRSHAPVVKRRKQSNFDSIAKQQQRRHTFVKSISTRLSH